MKKTRDAQIPKEPAEGRARKRVPRSMIACYGYVVDERGRLRVNESQADIVFYIFDSYISGQSLGQIAAALAQMGVASPTGKPTWSRATLAKILSNEKYAGDVILGRSRDNDEEVPLASQPRRLLRNHHTALISRSIFEIAQQEKLRRSRPRQVCQEEDA